MEFTNTFNVNLMPILKSSPKLIQFIPFINSEDKCYCCDNLYSVALLFKQKYCKYCLSSYIKYTANNNLDVHIYTNSNATCFKHQPRNQDFCTRNIQEWCNSCSEILYFKQIVTNHGN